VVSSSSSAAPPLRAAAEAVARDAFSLLEPLVNCSSVSGDVHGFERCVALVEAMLPPGARSERIPCSTASCAPDLLVHVRGTGSGRIVLLGHLDTVIPAERHRPLRQQSGQWSGSGTFDMKGGDALAVGLLRSLADQPERFAELALLLVADEEWRVDPFVHGPRFDGWDACLCFEGGERTADGDEAVVVRRKAAASIEVVAHGRSAHAGSRPDDGRNALVALADVALRLAAQHDPHGPGRLSVVPTIVHCGEALNVVPAQGTLTCDLRADEISVIERVLDRLPAEIDGVALESSFGRRWPGLDHRERATPVLERAGALLGRPIVAASRGGASDASHLAPWVGVAIDGLGPLGGGAHADDEHIEGTTLTDRAAVAVAVAHAVLDAV
jgi:glutamate carboxypeptidase